MTDNSQEILDRIADKAQLHNPWTAVGDYDPVTVTVDRRAAKALQPLFNFAADRISDLITNAALQGEEEIAAGAMAEGLMLKELVANLYADIKDA